MKARIAVGLLLLALIGLAAINIKQAQVIEAQRQEIRQLFKAMMHPASW